MSLIKKPNELDVNIRIKMLIYGQPGLGKTTAALSAPRPLLIDCDGGVNRVDYEFIKDTVQVTKYDDVLSLLNNEDLSAYDTLVFDTGGKLLDLMSDYIIATNPRMGRRNGTLTLEGYGQRKMEFNALQKLINKKGKHVVYVAHRSTEKHGDNYRYVPMFGGTNYDSLATELDLVGYLEADGRVRTITFDPTSKSEGKNTCNLPPVMNIPNLKDTEGNVVGKNCFLSDEVFSRYVNRLKERSAEGEAYKSLISRIEKDIADISTAGEATSYIAKTKEYAHIGSSMVVLKAKFRNRIEELGLTYNKEDKCYEIKEPSAGTDNGNG